MWYKKANTPSYSDATGSTGYWHCYPTKMVSIKNMHWPKFFRPVHPLSTTSSRIATTDGKLAFSIFLGNQSLLPQPVLGVAVMFSKFTNICIAFDVTHKI